jgi:hypothetical protein
VFEVDGRLGLRGLVLQFLQLDLAVALFRLVILALMLFNFFPLSLTTRPNKLKGLSLDTLSSQVLELECKARDNPIGVPFRCFLLW